jgi:hypothetical protein
MRIVRGCPIYHQAHAAWRAIAYLDVDRIGLAPFCVIIRKCPCEHFEPLLP